MKTERRTFDGPVELRQEGEKKKIRGTAAVFYDGTPRTEYRMDFWKVRERIDPAAFDGVMGNDVRGLFNHDPNLVLGRTPNTLRLTKTQRGLDYEIDPPDTTVGRDLLVNLERGDISGSSIGFRVAQDEWNEEADGWTVRTLLEFEQLYDVSPVTYPAYEATKSEARNFDEQNFERHLAARQTAEQQRIRQILDSRHRLLALEVELGHGWDLTAVSAAGTN